MNIYVISDTHFNHSKIVDYCKRPSNHEELLIEGMSRLSAGDCLIHLGDFSFGCENW